MHGSMYIKFLQPVWEPEVHYCIHISPSLVPNLNKVNPVFKIHFNVGCRCI